MAKKSKSDSAANPLTSSNPKKPTPVKGLQATSKGTSKPTAATHAPSLPETTPSKPAKRYFTTEKPLEPDESWKRIANASCRQIFETKLDGFAQ